MSTSLRFVTAGILIAATLAGVLVVVARRSPTPPPARASARSIHPFCKAAVEAHCQTRARCKTLSTEQLPACIEAQGEECDSQIGWKLAAGVLALDDEAAEECLEGMRHAGCNALAYVLGDDEQDMLEITTQCERNELLRPKAALDAPCSLSSDCLQGFCAVRESGCARCRAFAATGEPCEAGLKECDPSESYCAPSDGGELRCRRLKDEGSACESAIECRHRVCQPSSAGAAEQACRAAKAGEPCGQCEQESFCRRPAVEGNGTCVRRIETGDPCSVSDPDDQCADPEAHCIDGRCRIRPSSQADGAPCKDIADCAEGLYCKRSKTAAAICVPVARAKEPCAILDYGACGLDGRCIDGRCERLGALGEGCTGPFRCKDYLSCVPIRFEAGYRGGAKCVPDGEVGEPCSAHRACLSGSCDLTKGSGGICVPSAAAKNPCVTAASR